MTANSRREFLTRGLALTLATKSLAAQRGYTHAEAEKLLAGGNPNGKLTKDDLCTPALVLELDAFERNIQKMASYVKSKNLSLRPHAKTHKCPDIAKAQIQAGARGICSAKISEAEVFAEHGIRGQLITTAVVGKHKIQRAVQLAGKAPDTIFVVDDENNARELSEAAQASKVNLNVAIDLYFRRTGIEPGAPTVALVEKISKMPRLKLAGLQSYAGYASHTPTWAKRREVSREAMLRAVETRRRLEKSGFEVGFVTGGSTGTYNIDSDVEGMTELQPGSYIFMDVDYNRIGGQDGSEKYTDFDNALFVLTTVVSRPEARKAIVDGGFKAFSTDRSFGPEARDISGIQFSFAGDEHGSLDFSKASRELKVGDRLEFIIPHCDPTVNLYDRVYGVRGDKVEKVWRIAARGMSQ
jgi:D-serine deaminase-like pyridoxal phosphate-dependent protein